MTTKTRYCVYEYPNGDVCGKPMEVPDTSRREFCDMHRAAKIRARAKKNRENGQAALYQRTRYAEPKVRKMSPDYPAHRAAMVEQFGVKGGRAQCEHMVLRGVKL